MSTIATLTNQASGKEVAAAVDKENLIELYKNLTS
jgi:hypothetical protein